MENDQVMCVFGITVNISKSWWSTVILKKLQSVTFEKSW